MSACRLAAAPPRRRARRRTPCVLLAAALLAGIGCASVPPQGHVTQPASYPDGSSAEQAFWTFLWAWRAGDVAVLQQFLGMWLLDDLRQKLSASSAEEVGAWYRKGSAGLRLDSVTWRKSGPALAYVRVVVASDGTAPRELDFALLRRPDGWVVTGNRLLR